MRKVQTSAVNIDQKKELRIVCSVDFKPQWLPGPLWAKIHNLSYNWSSLHGIQAPAKSFAKISLCSSRKAGSSLRRNFSDLAILHRVGQTKSEAEEECKSGIRTNRRGVPIEDQRPKRSAYAFSTPLKCTHVYF